jgi:rubrerythrin
VTELFRGTEFYNVALGIERNGLAFYEHMFTTVPGDEARAIFHFLADQEREHLRIFQAMHDEAAAETPVEGYAGEYGAYIQSLADSHIFFAGGAVETLSRQTRGLQDAIRIGMQAEKDSILLYSEMKKHIPPDDYAALDNVIGEEKNHLQKLVHLQATTADEQLP